jgi:hypothetical protein
MASLKVKEKCVVFSCWVWASPELRYITTDPCVRWPRWYPAVLIYLG